MRKIDHCVLNNKKIKIGYLQYLSNDSDYSGTDSGGEGEDILCLLGTNFECFYFERGDFGEHFSGKCFYSESTLYFECII